MLQMPDAEGEVILGEGVMGVGWGRRGGEASSGVCFREAVAAWCGA
jgi:hypothetical protein